MRAELAEQRCLEAREDVAIATANAFFDLYTAEMGFQNAAANAAIRRPTLYDFEALRPLVIARQRTKPPPARPVGASH